jgi:hypothetical protein
MNIRVRERSIHFYDSIQGNAVLGRIGEGTGLGLPMVHGLNEHSGGELIPRSQKGRGTTAELWLPLAKKTEKATDTEAPVQVPAKEHGRPIMLAVDDDPLVLTNMAARLDDVGHKVFEASSAREVLAILRRESGIQRSNL